MNGPEGFSWIPGNNLPPGVSRSGQNQVQGAWQLLLLVFVDVIPQAWNQLMAYLDL